MPEFHKLGPTSELSSGETKQYEVEGRYVALCNVGGEFLALEDVCTHAFAHLTEGGLEGDLIRCPLHGATFDTKTGEPKSLPAVKPVPTHEVKIEDGQVYVSLNEKKVKVRGYRR